MHKGGLKQVSPEEITAAYIMAIARDIDNQAEDYILSAWLKYLRTCTCVFIVLDSDMEMYWHAAEAARSPSAELHAGTPFMLSAVA